MCSLKRKEASTGGVPPKSARSGKPDGRPAKRPKSDKKDDSKKEAEAAKPERKLPASAVTSILKEEEPLFPRGGGGVLTPLEYKQIQVQAKSDALFETSNGTTERGSEKRLKPNRKSSEGRPKPSTAAPAEESVRIESLNYKRLVKGSLVLGQISEITPLEIAVSLPNNLVGHLSVTSISQALTERIEAEAENANDDEDAAHEEVDVQTLFGLGQYIRVSVVSTEDDDAEKKKKRRIELSTRPELANAGLTDQDVVRNSTVMASVISVEDRGFVMDLGIQDSDLRGFLAKKELDPSIPEERLQPGAVILCLVTGKATNGKVAQLSANKTQLGSIKNVASDATTINTFLPGTAVDVLVSEVTARGLAGKVLGHLDATADMTHSGAGGSIGDLDEKYKVASKIKARVICTFPTADNPKVAISLLPHILSLQQQTAGGKNVHDKAPTQALPLSTIVESCVVRKAELNVGLWVDVGVEGVPGFVHISRVKDGKVDALYESSGPFKVGSTHRGRVIGYNAVDGIFLVSFEQKVLEQSFIRIEDVPVGDVVTGHIKKLLLNQNGISGLIVEIADGIAGLVPEIHFSDIKLQHPEKKFREGMKVTARVLSIDPANHQFRLTLKKTLVNSDIPPVKSFDDLSVGQQCLGTVVNVVPIGAYVQFYGDLRGFLPVAEMSEAFIRDPKEHFRQGQAVNVRVLRFDPDLNKLVVSCKDPSAFGVDKRQALQDLQICSIVSAKAIAKHDDSVEVEIVENGLKATLPIGHLSDRSPAKNQAALKRIHIGQVLPELLVLDKHEGRRVITVSQKPSLIAASKEGKLLVNMEDARTGSLVTGFVRNITPTAAFVQFAANIVALLPKPLMPRTAQAEPDFGLHKSQTLALKIISVENGRLVASLPSDVPAEEKDTGEKAGAGSRTLLNPVDSSLATFDDLHLGQITKARITSVKNTQLNVRLADNVSGRVDMSEIFDSWDDVPDAKSPLQNFEEGQILDVRILGVHDAKRRVYLPITQQKRRSVLELSIKPSSLQGGKTPDILSIDKVQVGSSWVAFVNNHGANCLWLSLTPHVRGRLYGMEASDDMSLVKDLEANFPVGMAIHVRVVQVDVEKGRIDLSARSPGGEGDLAWSSIEKNLVLPAKVTKVSDGQVLVQLSKTVSGPLHLVDIADDFDQATTTAYFKHDIIRVSVVSVDASNKRMRLSTRPSRVLNSSFPVEDREILDFSDVKPGSVIRGFVRGISDKGVFVNLGGDVVAFVRVTDLSDSFLKDWKAHFRIDQLVKGRVTAVKAEVKQIQMSLKASAIDENYAPLLTLDDLHEGQIVSGRVRKVADFGAFIVVDNSANVSGLCHRTEMADKSVRDATKLRVNLGLKPKYFEDESDSDEDAMSVDGGDNVADDVSDNGKDGADAAKTANGGGLSGGAFDWTGNALDQENGDSQSDLDEEDGGALVAKRSKRSKKAAAAADIDRTAQLDVRGPQTASDYERLLLGQADMSALWIEYMAFQVQVSELAKAREIAERAIKTINVRQETERLNVWIAYFNLEVEYGSEETADAVFKRACQYNDDREVFARAASIYIQSGKLNKADELFQTMTKKFGAQSPQIWINYAHFLHHSMHDVDRARTLLTRAVQTLGTSAATITLMSRFAALEFRSPVGNPEHGRTTFETLLDKWPKKHDIWDQLLDLETSVYTAEKAKGAEGKADPAVVRDVFERGTKAKGLKARRAKSWFQRWAKWEEQNGDAKSRARVTTRAKEWAAEAEKKKADAEGAESE
ncbi:rRNA biogenesis protein [Grosmannia clavigera kw1407]|uniref:rRNA biogenesis protein RRP5 n=1 Tax=Grosmannia clavigera (strain kw1407 / UAMH 11150) TaxID=655863 RepID=F0XIY5_GROCL|nr:rRNA biogenesis protein [Grosmannia clavigera kw1407]EFX02430.1 rRNA biogenesis protein [Grosmannia clavigera kw1407]